MYDYNNQFRFDVVQHDMTSNLNPAHFLNINQGGIHGEVGLNTFRNAISAHYLPHSSEYVAPPSIDVVRKWLPTIGYGEDVSTKETLRKSLIPTRWRLLMAQIIQCLGGKTGRFDQITNKDAIMLYSIANGIHIDYANIFWENIILKLKKKQREKVVPYTRFLSLLIMHKMKEDYGTDEQRGNKRWSSKAPTGSKTGHSKRRKESSLAMDSNPNQPSVSTPIDTEIHKEDHQATGGPTSLRVTNEERSNLQLSSANFTAEADPRLSAPNDFIPPQQGMYEGTKNTSYDHISAGIDPYGASFTAIHGDKEEASIAIHGDKEEASSTIKLEDLVKLVSQIQPSFKDLDSPEYDPIIIVDESDEDEPNAETEDTSVPRSSSPSSLPTELKDLPSKFNELTEEIKRLKTQVHKLEIKLPKELKEIPTKLEDFTKTATTKVESAQAKLKTLDALPRVLLNVIKTLNKFAEVLESTSTKVEDQSVPSAGQADTMPAEGEKDTNQALSPSFSKEELIRLLKLKKKI
uniref:Uncharacterized protein n=1 Tax=Tanacetum cinerariifolium TaxID=118510 RepID=A0A6L2KW87_TANCI|nr:hypothetical protein [Tanacetum cinerariifolium]